jgi:hypothetical protein
LGCQQQSAGLQRRARRHAFDHVGAGERHNAARLLAAGRNHGLARFEPDAAVVAANPERVGGEVAVRHILCEPSPKFVVGNGEHVG